MEAAAKYGNGRVLVNGYESHGSYVIDVVDNGPGVPPEVEERMFQRFIHRGDEPLIVGSVGLGLAICRVLAQGMNGLVTYHRRDGHTVFEVVLQLAPTELPPDPSPAQAPRLVDEESTADHSG